jgi:hypothetical protein
MALILIVNVDVLPSVYLILIVTQIGKNKERDRVEGLRRKRKNKR